MRKSLMLAIVISTLGTAILFSVDRSRTRDSERELAYRLAHQVAAQAEAFWIAARNEWPERKKNDFREEPVDWVVKKLTQGRDPRVIQVARATEFSTTRDFFEWNGDTGYASLLKPLSTPERAGVNVKVFIAPAGFLGTRNAFTHDLAILSVFISLVFWVFAANFIWERITLIRQGQKVDWNLAKAGNLVSTTPPKVEPVVAQQQPAVPLGKIAGAVSDAFRSRLLNWGQGIRQGMGDAGMSFKNTFKEASVIAKASVETNRLMVDLKSEMTVEMADLGEARKDAVIVAGHLGKAEAAALNLYLDVTRGNFDPKTMELYSRTVQENIKQARGLADSQHKFLDQMDSKLKPWTAIADQAIQNFESTLDAAKLMDGQIESARAALVFQAKIIQEMFREAERADDAKSLLNATKAAPRKAS